MKTIIAGSRTITDNKVTWEAIRQCPWHEKISLVVCGGCEGPDLHGDQWAYYHSRPVEYFLITRKGQFDYMHPPLINLGNRVRINGEGLNIYDNTNFGPDWSRDGLKAGPMRNEAMASYADALLAIWDGKMERSGTANMILTAHRYGLRVHVHVVAPWEHR